MTLSERLTLTLTLDTSIYASGDVLADTQELQDALRRRDAKGILRTLTVIDKDDQGAAMDVYFFSRNVSLGTENSTPSLTDANFEYYLGHISVESADYKDLGGAQVACIKNENIELQSSDASRNVYVAVVTRGTPTHTASGIVLGFGILW
ncbi:MAG: hypothetical protein HUU41_13525 [Bryobacteraceae bacterium]|nr:hypothetical protein [Bryobacteraceae bacterium]